MAYLLTTRILRPAIQTALAVLTLLMMTGCEQRELCYDHSHTGDLTLLFDWQLVPDAKVQGLTTLYYSEANPQGGGDRYDYTGMQGGKATLKPGTYRALAYNYDTESILYRYVESLESAEAYTRPSSIVESTRISSTRGDMPKAHGAEEEPVILEPDYLCGGASSVFTIEPGNATTVSLAPDLRSVEVVIRVDNVPNIEHAKEFGGSLTGLSPSIKVASGEISNEMATQAFSGYRVGDSSLEMRLRIFGHCPHEDLGDIHTHLLTIYSVLDDGTQWYFTQDVSEQMHDPELNPEEDHVNIELEEIPLPEPTPTGDGSGFQPTIDGWQSIEIEVTM